jgi:glycosyltransferase involved in cell wall biosynthesis
VKILWHGPHPDMPTGYGTQTALLLPRFQALGHDVAVSVTAGQDSHPGFWHGIPVFPKTPYADTGEDVVRNHYDQFGADVVFTFLCTWIIRYPQVWRDMRTIHLTPVDCDPMSIRDYGVIADTGGMPAAISPFGERVMRAGGPGRQPLDPLFLPHGVDTKTFSPRKDRDAMRAEMGYDGKFVVGMNFMNNDKFRKNIDECFQAFAVFHGKHPDAILAVHAIQALPEGWNLPAMCQALGITQAVRFSPQYPLVAGLISPAMVADWYAACDVLLSPGNEGFGLCAVESQACGTPVILGDWSTGPDLVGKGWLVQGGRRYNDVHQAFWGVPYVDSVVSALEEAYEDARNRREDARDFAAGHDIGRVVREHWEPVLGELG